MKVVVLMSTYNGAQFVAEQVASILRQLPPEGLLLVRDDGSSDDTVARIEAFPDPRIRIERGKNLGFGASFLTLLNDASDDAEMVMFSDQDDVWLPGKIESAWEQLHPLADTPALYSSRLQLVTEDLRFLALTQTWPRGPTLQGALAENIVTGCTAALNAAAVRTLKQAGVPRSVHFHDWWVYLVISATGRVVVDSKAPILYRQHGGNVIGRGASWWTRQVQMGRFLRNNDWVGVLLGQAYALKHHYERQLGHSARSLLARHFLFEEDRALPSWRLIFSARRWRQHLAEEVFFRGLLTAYRLRLWPPKARRRKPASSHAAAPWES